MKKGIKKFIVGGVVLLGAGVCAAEPVTMGEVTIPWGELGFPDEVTCESGMGCGGDYIFNSGYPDYRYTTETNALKYPYRLSGVADDLSETDKMRLNFPVPVVNQAGPDLYLAQAKFSGTDLGFQDPFGVNDFLISFDNALTWQTVAASAFVEDTGVAVFFSDESLVESVAYKLYFTTIDLSDYGYAAGAAITGLNIRGPDIEAVVDNNYLDVVAVANMNKTKEEVWRGRFFTEEELGDVDLKATLWGRDADANGNGNSNWWEYVFGGHPREGGAGGAGLSATVGGSGRLRFTYPRRTDDPALVYTPGVSGDLEGWHSEATYLGETGTMTLDAEFELVTVESTAMANAAGRLFGQVTVTEVAP